MTGADKSNAEPDSPRPQISVESVYRQYESGPDGISDAEAAERTRQYGPNDIPQKHVSPVLRFLKSFWGPIPWMIEAAAILSAIIGEWDDFAIILLLLLINAAVGFWQEQKADDAIALLKQRLALKARVKRSGSWREIPAGELVPGDLVRIRLGEIVPADLVLVGGEYLQADESALTGESLPVDKIVLDAVYSGSIIRQGEMEGMVTAIGYATFFGKTARLVGETVETSHFQRAVVKIGDYLIAMALVVVLIIVLISLYRHESLTDTIQYALVLTVAAIPAALPAVLSVTMAVGATVLASKEAIVSRLAAIEELAGMDVLCTDKTGTITENRLAFADSAVYGGENLPDLLLFAALASREEDRDPIDSAILARATSDPEFQKRMAECRITAFSPFDPVSKRTGAAVERSGGKNFSVSKGAPQAILSLTGDTGASAWLDEKVGSFAEKGYRAIAVAKKDGEGDWHMTGLIGLHDPPRPDSGRTIARAGEMGVAVKMITGDHSAIGREIARQVGLGDHFATASDFADLPVDKAERIIDGADGFAEVFPEHKYRIVSLLQGEGHIVGMTGDGVNDAPALKKADVGIAVMGATDAAKSAADIVLTSPGLSVIIDAVVESRKIFQRMNNYAIYRIAETLRVLLFISASIIIFRFYPVTAIMIVLLAILNDFPIMTISYDNVRRSPKPERWEMRNVIGIATLLGVLGVMETFALLYIGLDIFGLDTAVLQSFIYLKLSVAGHFCVFMARTRGPFWSIRPAAPLLIAVILTQLTATVITVYGILLPAIGWPLALFVWGYAALFFVIIDTVKVAAYRLLDHTGIAFRR